VDGAAIRPIGDVLLSWMDGEEYHVPLRSQPAADHKPFPFLIDHDLAGALVNRLQGSDYLLYHWFIIFSGLASFKHNKGCHNTVTKILTMRKQVG
jgi:hypothetical protein